LSGAAGASQKPQRWPNVRFPSQFRIGSGDYTKERGQWLDGLSLEQIVSEIKAKRSKTRRKNA